MSHFSELINFCKTEYERLPFCQQCQMMSGCHRGCGEDCYNCLNYIHKKSTTAEHYSCNKITYNYLLKHGNQFASEVAKAIYGIRSGLLQKDPITILSVGCGPSTELYSAIEILKGHKIKYYGFDRSDIWVAIQHFNIDQLSSDGHDIQYLTEDFFDFVQDSRIQWDVLILNYFFSDFVKYSPKETDGFIDRLAILIKNGAFRYVIINDVSLFYGTGTGYSCIESLARKMKSSEKFNINCWRFHFKYPNEYQPTYGRKLNDSLYFPIEVDRIGTYNPFATCRSILYISSITPKS